MEIVNSGSRAFDLPAGGILAMRQEAPGATAVAALASQDGATGFTQVALTSATPVSIGPFTADCVINVAAAGKVGVHVTGNAVIKATDFRIAATDTSAAPGNATINTGAGRAAFAIAAATCVITNALVTANSIVLATLEGVADATLTSILGITLGAGSFTVTGNATATAAKKFSFIVVNP